MLLRMLVVAMLLPLALGAQTGEPKPCWLTFGRKMEIAVGATAEADLTGGDGDVGFGAAARLRQTLSCPVAYDFSYTRRWPEPAPGVYGLGEHHFRLSVTAQRPIGEYSSPALTGSVGIALHQYQWSAVDAARGPVDVVSAAVSLGIDWVVPQWPQLLLRAFGVVEAPAAGMSPRHGAGPGVGTAIQYRFGNIEPPSRH